MNYLIWYITVVIINHILIYKISRMCSPPPKNEYMFLFVCMFLPIINFITLLVCIIILLAAHDKAPLNKFYKFVFNETDNV